MLQPLSLRLWQKKERRAPARKLSDFKSSFKVHLQNENGARYIYAIHFLFHLSSFSKNLRTQLEIPRFLKEQSALSVVNFALCLVIFVAKMGF